jgi:hypothetical protein
MVTIIKEGTNKATISQLLDKLKYNKGINAKKFCGVIKLKKHPLTIQKEMRDEWS